MEKLYQQRTSHDGVPSDFYDVSDLDIPKENIPKKWQAFCFGRASQNKDNNSQNIEGAKLAPVLEEIEPTDPLLRVILSCDQVFNFPPFNKKKGYNTILGAPPYKVVREGKLYRRESSMDILPSIQVREASGPRYCI